MTDHLLLSLFVLFLLLLLSPGGFLWQYCRLASVLHHAPVFPVDHDMITFHHTIFS